jgi:hypothetical protein
MELSGLKVYDSGVPLHPRKNLADERQTIHPVYGGAGHQDGHEKCTWPSPCLSPSIFHLPLTRNLLRSLS